MREELAFGLENLGVPREEMEVRIDEVLALLDLQPLAERSPYALSGGNNSARRSASILVMRPEALLLDEPTAQLDLLGAREVFAAIRSLSETGITVVLIEHKPELIAAFADQVVILHEGRIVAQGAPATILAVPELPGLGITTSRWTEAARAGRERGLWPTARPLPVTLEDAVAGFSEGGEPTA